MGKCLCHLVFWLVFWGRVFLGEIGGVFCDWVFIGAGVFPGVGVIGRAVCWCGSGARFWLGAGCGVGNVFGVLAGELFGAWFCAACLSWLVFFVLCGRMWRGRVVMCVWVVLVHQW